MSKNVNELPNDYMNRTFMSKSIYKYIINIHLYVYTYLY